MKKAIIFSIALLFPMLFYAQNQSVIGKWKSVDDESGKAESIVEIYEKSGKIYGKVIEILDVEHKKSICDNCTGEDKNKPILGMIIIRGLKKDRNEYNSGKVLYPKNGKLYSCIITMENKDKIKLRGYIGFSLLGRSQYWYRVK